MKGYGSRSWLPSVDRLRECFRDGPVEGRREAES